MSNKDIGTYQTSFDEIANIRNILKINYERSSQLSSIEYQIVAISAVIIVGAISLFGTSYFSSTYPANVWIAVFTINLLCVILIFWRYSSHVIYNKIIHCYKKIIYCENKLNIPYEISLLLELENDIEYNNTSGNKISYELKKHKRFMEQDFEKKSQIIQGLIEKHKLGSQFHEFFDYVATMLVVALIILEYYFALAMNALYSISFTSLNEPGFFISFIIFPLLYVFASYGLLKEISEGFPIQRNPTDKEIDNSILEM